MISQAGLLTINPNILLPVCDQLARDGVFAKDLQKKNLSHFIDTVTWVAAHGILHPKISERPHTSHVAPI